MRLNIPKNTEKYEWTKHSLAKMQYYGLTAQRVLRLIKAPMRKEEGVAEKTVAVMQPASVSTKNGKRVWTSEIWAMYQLRDKVKNRQQKTSSKSKLLMKPKINEVKKIKIISAWRYPGVSPKNNPVPEEIMRELEEIRIA